MIENLGYSMGKKFASLITDTYFRNINVIGEENIPKTGPLIICSNHNNQFMDGLILASRNKRQVRFIVANKSYKRPIVGDIMRILKGIPVERAQDLAVLGQGGLMYISSSKLQGINTKFLSQVKEGNTITVKELKSSEFLVKQVISDTELIVTSSFKEILYNKNYNFKIQPKIDYSEMYNNVWEALNKDDCIGIFPEGGSHDQTDLLPLKAGVCIMALGAMAKYNKSVTIITAGLNYFGGHRFRSKMILEFSQPFKIPESILKLYHVNKRDAIKELLDIINGRLRDVVMTGPTYKDLATIYLARRIYMPDSLKSTPEQGLKLSRLFGLWYKENQENQQVKLLFDEIKAYRTKLHNIGIKDIQVKGFQKHLFKDSLNLVSQLIQAGLAALLNIPNLILNGPIVILLRILAEKQRIIALKGSSVKVQGKDVVASYSVLYATIIYPIAQILQTILFNKLCKKYIPSNSIFKKRIRLLTFIFYVFFPFLQLGMFRYSDNLFRIIKHLKANFLFLIGKRYAKLKDERQVLQNKIRKLVQEFEEKSKSNKSSRTTSYEDLFKVTQRINNIQSSQELSKVFSAMEQIDQVLE